MAVDTDVLAAGCRPSITADAGDHSDANIQHLKYHNIPALIADIERKRARNWGTLWA